MIKRAYLQVNMFEGSIIKNLMLFALPLWGSQVLQVFYNLVDMLIVGQFGGKSALAAVGATAMPYDFIIHLLMGIATGVGVLIAQQFGGEKYEELRETISTSALLSTICGTLMAALAFVLTPFLLNLIKTPAEVFGDAVLYFRILIFGIPALILYNVGAAILQSIGDTKRPFLFLVFSSVIHVLIALILVVTFKLNLVGVALATVISQYVSAILVWHSLITIPKSFHYEIKSSKLYMSSVKKIFALGIPSGLQAAMFPISNMIVQAAINELGTDVVAGTTAGMNAEKLVYTLMRAIGTAALVFAGQNMGAGNVKRLKKLFFGSIISNAIFGGVLCAIIVIFAEPFTKLFISDPNALHYGVLRVCCICTLYCISGCYESVLSIVRGMGKSLLPMIGAVVGICVTRVIWVYFFYPSNPSYTHLMTCFPISWSVAFIIQTILFIVYYNQFSKKNRLPK